MGNKDTPKKVLLALLMSVYTYMSSGGININLPNNSINYIQNQTNNYYYLKDGDKT